MSSTFHLAIPVTSIEQAEKFYCDLLGCKKGNYEEGKWQDINFWGNELTLHEADHALPNERHHVCLLYTSPSPRDVEESRMPSSA